MKTKEITFHYEIWNRREMVGTGSFKADIDADDLDDVVYIMQNYSDDEPPKMSDFEELTERLEQIAYIDILDNHEEIIKKYPRCTPYLNEEIPEELLDAANLFFHSHN